MKVFIDKYTVVEGLSVENKDCSHLLETYGEDYYTVKKIGKKTPKRIWTIVDVGLNYNLAIAGIHHTDRVNYVITEEEWQDENEEYMY